MFKYNFELLLNFSIAFILISCRYSKHSCPCLPLCILDLTAGKSTDIKMTLWNVQRFKWTSESIMHLIIWKQLMKFEMILFGKTSRGQGYSEFWRAECGFWFLFFFHDEMQLKKDVFVILAVMIQYIDSVQHGNERSGDACSCCVV